MPETKNENLFRTFYGTNTFIEKADIDKTKYPFKSKSGNGNGYPDFFNNSSIDNWIIIVECKATDHEKAEQEVCYYMSNEGIKDKYNRIGIATSGENENELKVSYYYALKNQKATKLKLDSFIELDKLQQIVENETLEIEKEALLNYRTKLNDYFDFEYFNKIEVKNRPLFFAVLLLMKDKIKQFLDEEKYVKIYKNNVYLKDEFDNLQQDKIEQEKVILFNNSNSNDKIKYFNKFLYDTFSTKIKENQNNKYKEQVIENFNFLKLIDPAEITLFNNTHTHTHNSKWGIYKEFLLEFCEKFNDIRKLQKEYDIIGLCYIEFFKYSTQQLGGDIILTPEHIKDFMCRVAGVNSNKVVLDICTGTGGFLIKAMQIMFEETQDVNKQATIKKENLIGVEYISTMYCMAFINMMLNLDGKTNLMKGNCLVDFDDGILKKTLAKKPAKIGIINPPYNDNQAIVFTKRLLDLLDVGGVGCVIAPANTLLKNPQQAKELLQKHSLRKYVLLPANLFVMQAGAQQTAIFLFEAHTQQREDDLVYFYNLSDDGYKYSSRKTYDLQGVAEDVYKKAIYNVKNEIIISKPTGNDRESYKEKLDLETMKNAIFTTKIQNELKMSDFAKTIIDYYIYEIEEQKRKLCSGK